MRVTIRSGGNRGGRRPLSAAALLLLVSIVGCGRVAERSEALAPANATPELPASSAPASYTSDQADRGAQVFTTVCSACHAAAEFQGRLFELTWMARPISHFFEQISTAMPQDRPGALSPAEYASIVAHVLRLNGVPPGAREFPGSAAELEGLRWR